MIESCPTDCPLMGSARRDPWKRGADRREFLEWILFLSMSCLTLLSPSRASAKTVAIQLGTLRELAPVGGSVVVKLAERRLLLIRESPTNVLAFSAVCTHKKTTVGYDAWSRVIRCPKHDSVFDLAGRRIDGPAPRPLARYPTRLLEDGRILVKLD